jgi:CheY-like chemotaxis protein
MWEDRLSAPASAGSKGCLLANHVRDRQIKQKQTVILVDDDASLLRALLDIYLPKMGGVELCGALAASGRSLPTILMTGNDGEATQKIAREAGVFATLYKPFDEDVLLDTIARALGNNRIKPANNQMESDTRGSSGKA